MLWFLGIFSLVILAMFYLGIRAELSNQRRAVDPTYDAKVTTFWKKVNPYWEFAEKLLNWLLIIAVIYYIYLG